MVCADPEIILELWIWYIGIRNPLNIGTVGRIEIRVYNYIPKCEGLVGRRLRIGHRIEGGEI